MLLLMIHSETYILYDKGIPDTVAITPGASPLTCGDRVISLPHNQYHGCWCPGSFRHPDISNYDIDYVESVSSCLTWGRISTICVMSVWINDVRCKYMFMFPLKNLARKVFIFRLWPCTFQLLKKCFCICRMEAFYYHELHILHRLLCHMYCAFLQWWTLSSARPVNPNHLEKGFVLFICIRCVCLLQWFHWVHTVSLIRTIILWVRIHALIARFKGPTWGPCGADRTQMGPMLANEPCYLGVHGYSYLCDHR